MGWIGASVVAMCPLHALVSLLRFDGQGGDWPSFEAADADRFVSLFAIAVGAVVDPVKRRVDLGDQPAFTRPSSELDGPFGFERGAVGQIGFEQTFFLQVLKCIRRLGQQLGSPAQQLLSKIFDLKGIHEFFIVGRMTTWR